MSSTTAAVSPVAPSTAPAKAAHKRSRPANSHEPHKRIKKNPVKQSPRPFDIYVTDKKSTPVRAYVARAQQLLDKEHQPFVVIHGLGKAIYKATLVATVLQERCVGNLNMTVETDTVQLADELDYKNEDLEPEMDVRNSSAIHITVSRKQSLDSIVGSLKSLAEGTVVASKS
ncbi:hypothetical protein BCR44DRAFT_24231 [Catenaria anguillulae PL171]|uniref:Uncharacterized protein n=1 Tax=Catenaria anguillulae PL171 TaxID=765915 RepID=A0A1Y2I2C3_9FUNG|nr:hypothetical protein BCR44DRAFT_24231 [Catenaria anguillulae PL171]